MPAEARERKTVGRGGREKERPGTRGREGERKEGEVKRRRGERSRLREADRLDARDERGVGRPSHESTPEITTHARTGRQTHV